MTMMLYAVLLGVLYQEKVQAGLCDKNAWNRGS